MTLDEMITRAKKASENQHMNDRFRENTKQLAEWLEELKQYKEENQPEKSGSYQELETNLDHYKNVIQGNGMWNLAVVEGKPKRCDCIACGDCDFYKDGTEYCLKESMDWLKQQYTKPTYELTKFENDLLQSYLKSSLLSGYEFKSIPILKRMKGKGYFKDVDEDATIEDILADCEITEED